MKHWVFDLDGTLAEYDGIWHGPWHIGKPIKPMIDRIHSWIADGYEVRIFTARVSGEETDARVAEKFIHKWLTEHLGFELRVTCQKDYSMIELWDDRAVQVKMNTGEPVGYSTRGLK